LQWPHLKISCRSIVSQLQYAKSDDRPTADSAGRALSNREEKIRH